MRDPVRLAGNLSAPPVDADEAALLSMRLRRMIDLIDAASPGETLLASTDDHGVIVIDDSDRTITASQAVRLRRDGDPATVHLMRRRSQGRNRRMLTCARWSHPAHSSIEIRMPVPVGHEEDDLASDATAMCRDAMDALGIWRTDVETHGRDPSAARMSEMRRLVASYASLLRGRIPEAEAIDVRLASPMAPFRCLMRPTNAMIGRWRGALDQPSLDGLEAALRPMAAMGVTHDTISPVLKIGISMIEIDQSVRGEPAGTEEILRCMSDFPGLADLPALAGA